MISSRKLFAYGPQKFPWKMHHSKIPPDEAREKILPHQNIRHFLFKQRYCFFNEIFIEFNEQRILFRSIFFHKKIPIKVKTINVIAIIDRSKPSLDRMKNTTWAARIKHKTITNNHNIILTTLISRSNWFAAFSQTR